MPRLLVDVRHEAAHNELPALPLLRVAVRAALAWLAGGYWQRQADHLAACRARIAELLQVRWVTSLCLCVCMCCSAIQTASSALVVALCFVILHVLQRGWRMPCSVIT